jgi:cellulose synthase/poly-beta-1,6-N-acetylglucosamine synthase-like glycosyltransferase
MILSIFVTLLQIPILLALAYHYFLLLASLPTPNFKPKTAKQNHRFALAIPAHNEMVVIGQTIGEMFKLDYPRHLYDVFVVADHCQDHTAQVALSAGAICFERNTEPSGRKGYALARLLECILSADRKYDAVIVFDADSRLNKPFLQAMNEGLNSHFLVLQGQHVISNTDEALFNRLAAIDMRLNNRLRNRARHNLGSSCRLMGDAMCFSHQVLVDYPWDTFSLSEDIEYGVQLLNAGMRIGYVENAISYGQAAGGWQQAKSQRLRWESGVLGLRRHKAWRLFTEGFRQRRWSLLDRGTELLLPPYTALVAFSVLVLIIQYILSPTSTFLSIGGMLVVIAGWVLIPFLGLLLDKAPCSLFSALIYGPFYVLWRIWITTTAGFRGRGMQWVRTPRSEE